MNPMNPSRVSKFDLPHMHRYAVGFDQLFNELWRNAEAANNVGNYPPYNVIQFSETEYSIEIAVAGFMQSELDVELKDGQLNVVGTKEESLLPKDVRYLHQGISNRDFIRVFNLAETIEIRGAVVENGLLKIQLERIIPESSKPKKIPITYKK